MEALDYRQRIIDELKDIPSDRLRVVMDFIGYIKDRRAWEATMDVLSDGQMMEDIEAVDKDRAEGKSEEFVRWEDMK